MLHQQRRVPPEGKSIPSDDVARLAVARTFFRLHRPPDLADDDAGLGLFVRDYVAPWASQAQISIAIAEDYEEMATTERDDLPIKPTHDEFGTPGAEPGRGERRAAAVQLSAESRKVLQARFGFVTGLRAVSEPMTVAFKLGGASPAARKLLGPLRDVIAKIMADYGFVVGDVAVVEKQLPLYRKDVETSLKALELLAEKSLDTVVEALQDALEGADPSQSTGSKSTAATAAKSSRSAKSVGRSGPKSVEKSVPASSEVRSPSGGILTVNVTLGDGNCFLHALHEAQNGVRSNDAAQAALRRRVVAVFQANPRLRVSHFGAGVPGEAAYQQFRATILGNGVWVGDQTPAMVADALGLRIVIHRPDGSVYFDARPNPVISPAVTGAEVHVCYTGNHYNSYTAVALP